VWFHHSLLLGGEEEVDSIVAAIAKIQAHRGELARLPRPALAARS
jgi:hypothetical protein